MKFSCEKALLQSAVNTTSRAVAAKSSIPALEGILLEGGDTLTLSGYNMQTGIRTGVDVFKIQDVAEDLVVPIMDFPIRIDRDALTLGYAGVYGSFLLFAKRASVKYGIPARDILVELGRRGMVGGQEDMIEDTAITMARERGLLA